jgi:hypothetical protein
MNIMKIEKLTDALYTRHTEDIKFDAIFDWVASALEDLLDECDGEVCGCCVDKRGLFLSTWGIDFINVGVRARLRMCEALDLEDYTDEEIGMAVFPVLAAEWGPTVRDLLSDEDEGGSVPPAATQLN